MSINIRLATVSDLDNIVELHLKLLAFEGEFEGDRKNIEWAYKNIINSENSFIVVIELDKKIIGMCSLQTLISTIEGGNICYIEDVYIEKDYRTFGYGIKLMEFVENFCKKLNYKRIQLLCKIDNNRAVKFYERLGFSKFKRFFFIKPIK
ncbi:MAG: GNAT family N-acetyltransferase [Deferribacterota bacterium]|nr:GNAT family N-acetyltransferase [Deferribacterota bacterium]